MKLTLLYILVSVFLFLNNYTDIQAQTTYSADNYAINADETDDSSFLLFKKVNKEPNLEIELKDLKNTTSEELTAKNDDNLVWDTSSSISVTPAIGSYLGGCNSEDYFIAIQGGVFGNGWDISSVTICGTEVCQIIVQSSNEVIVFPNAGIPGTGDIVITSKSMGKTIIKNGFTYSTMVPEKQASGIQFSKVDPTSADISLNSGNGNFRTVFVTPANGAISNPEDQMSYSASEVFNNGTQISTCGWYCVYNGDGSNGSIPGLNSGTNYIVQVGGYSNSAGFENYLISSTKENPKILIAAPDLDTSTNKKISITNTTVPSKDTMNNLADR